MTTKTNKGPARNELIPYVFFTDQREDIQSGPVSIDDNDLGSPFKLQ